MTISSAGEEIGGPIFARGAIGQFARDAGRYLPSTLLPSLFALVAVTIFTRTFDPVQYGLFSLALAIIGPPVDMVTETVGEPTGRYYAEYRERDRSAEFHHAVGYLTTLAGAVTVLLGLLAIGGIVVVTGSTRYLWLLTGAGVLALVQVMTNAVMPILRARLRPRPYQLATILSSGLFVVIAVGMVHYLGHNVAWLLWAQVIAGAVLLPYVYHHTNVRLGRSILHLTPELRHTVKRFLRYGVPMMLWFVACNILHREDVYVIGLFRGSGEVGIYTVNYNLIFSMSTLVTTPVLLAAGPILYHQWAHHQVDEAQGTISRMTELYAMLGLPFIGGIVALGRPFVSVVLGSQFTAGASILVPVAVGRVLWGAANVGHKGLELSERPLTIAGSAFAAGALNLALNVMLVPRYGYLAAAYVTLVSYAAYTALIWWQSRSCIPWQLKLSSLWRYAVPAVAATAAAMALDALFPAGANVQRLVLGGVCFVAVYLCLVVLLARKHVHLLFSPPAAL